MFSEFDSERIYSRLYSILMDEMEYDLVDIDGFLKEFQQLLSNYTDLIYF